jgi:hypothetical protein
LRLWAKERENEFKKVKSNEDRVLSDLRAMTSVKLSLEKEVELAYAQI